MKDKPFQIIKCKKIAIAVFVGLIFVVSMVFFLNRDTETEKTDEPQAVKIDEPQAVKTDEPQAVKLGEPQVDVIYPVSSKVIENNPVDNKFLSSVKEFSYKTASQVLSETGGNINYSPISLYFALAMAASGAKGETADEMLALLGVADSNTLSLQCNNLYRLLYTDNEIGQLKLANSLWLNSKAKFKNDFVQNAADNFYAHSFNVDFADETISGLMAKWVSENTNGLLIPEFSIDSAQIMSIINTIYFYDEWTSRFDVLETAEDVFYLSDGSLVNCDFMNSSSHSFSFAKGEGFTRSGLGLKNAGQMVFILPDEGVSPRELLNSPEKMKMVFEQGEEKSGKVVWQIPKFSFGSDISIEDTLKTLGIKSAFSDNADFSDITNQSAAISDIIQQTHIGIDEIGVEAAAYTMIIYDRGGIPDERADMILNRPFIYGITEFDGTLLFVGICDNPS